MTKRNRKHKNMRAGEFKSIKMLTDAGVPINMAGKISQRSWIVVSNVKKAKTFDEYKELVRKYMEKYEDPAPSIVNDEETPVQQDTVSLQLSKILLDLDKIKRRLLILG